MRLCRDEEELGVFWCEDSILYALDKVILLTDVRTLNVGMELNVFEQVYFSCSTIRKLVDD